MHQAMYEIRVAGDVPEEDLRDLGAVSAGPERVSTVLYGIEDEAALYGLLARLRSLGIEVLEVRRLPEADSADDAGSEAPGGAG
jgi:hypothetical protein